jgi:hypothetical protein
VADHAGPGFTVEPTSSPGRRHVAAQVEADGRSAHVVMAGDGRCFSVSCRAHGVPMASGDSQDLTEVAGATRSWHQGPRVRELTAQWAFLRTGESAEALERGEAVPARWEMVHRPAAADAERRQGTRSLGSSGFAVVRD